MSSFSQLNDNQLLEQQQQKSWQEYSQQHDQSYQVLTPQQLEHFKLAITLSDFVLTSALQAPELVIELFVSNSVYLTSTPHYEALLKDLLKDCQSEEQLHRVLRRFRLQQMVNIAIADLVLDIELKCSLERLSLLADALIQSSLHWLTKFCQDKWGIPTSTNGELQQLLVYGMGKLGGKELNFSSDIDLIFVYPHSGETQGCRRSLDNQQFFTRLAQKLITSLHQHTADGFVYRVDMRLRPFGESGPLVLTFNAMEDYYQEQGRDWERYAMLKARVIPAIKTEQSETVDTLSLETQSCHQQLSALLKPFVYRRYIDFSVIDSLRRMKSMISQEVRRKQLVNNIKLGAGGIREIEFIVQVFQLIRGGRVKELQQRNLLTVLPELVIAGELDENSKEVLQNAYCFLRRVENILQALADKQTQTLPENDLDKARLLFVLNFTCWDDFIGVLQSHMDNVHEKFSELIGIESPNHQAEDQHWSALWNSRWSNEESIAWVEQEQVSQNMALWNSENIWHLLSDFRDDVSKRSIGSRGRQVLDKLIPLLICHIQQAEQAEFVLERVLHVFKRIVTRTAYLELLFENEGALKQLIHLCQASNWVTNYIAKYPILLDELIDPKLLHNPPKLSDYGVELRENMLRIPEEDLEAQMDGLRLFKQAQQLRIAAADIAGVLDVKKVSDHLTALAEAIINEVINIAWQQVANRFGVPTSTVDSGHKGFAVIAYGKTGGKELSYGSDLDLVFVHNSPQGEETTGLAGGDNVVSASQFYVKFAQRIMHIFNTRMNGGVLYELDMRLRPSGNSGVLVIHISTFGEYQRQEAWTWEHQALVRARVVYGNSCIFSEFEKIREQVLTNKRDIVQLKEDVREMREKMRNHLDKSDGHLIDIKQGGGGLVDIEFLAQYLVLAHSSAHKSLTSRCDTLGIFKLLVKVELLSDMEEKLLTNCYKHLRHLGHQATLKNEALLIDTSLLPEKEQVIKLWDKLV